MNVTLFSATGKAGSRIMNELLTRGHNVTAVVRDTTKVAPAKGLKLVAGDLSEPAAEIAKLIPPGTVVVSAYGPPPTIPEDLPDVTRRLLDAVKIARSQRFIMVGGAASLEVAPGKQLIDIPDFPKAWKGIAGAHREALEMMKKWDMNWTNFSPAAMFAPGERTGKFRLGKDTLIANAAGESKISMEDYAIALVDEIEKPKHERMRFTIGY